MTRTPLTAVSIAAAQDAPPLSRGQKAFNKLIGQIEQKRTELAAWEAITPPYQQKYTRELVPLLDASVALQVRMVQCLDRASAQKGLTKTERHMLSGMIADMAGALIAESDVVALKEIYNRHSNSDYDAEETDGMQSMKSMLEAALNIELGDDFDFGKASPEDLLRHAQAQFEAQQEKEDAHFQAQEAHRSKRKKSARQLAKEAQQQAEAQEISQSIREVYRKLASALHPDRETDAAERERKTALMQRANQAYAKNNLLQLLELQLELEHIDQSAINNLSEDRLKHYNTILKEQLGELAVEIHHVEGQFRAQFGISPFVAASPRTLLRSLAKEIAGVQHAIRVLEKDLLAFEDVKNVKAWLKEMRRQPAMNDFDDRFF